MKKTILIAAVLILALPAAALADEVRDRVEAALFRAYWLETGKRDPAAAAEAYEDALWEGKEFPDLAIRGYLGLARTRAALGHEGAGKYLDTAVQHYEQTAEKLPEEVAKALKEEIDDTAAVLRPGGGGRTLDEEIRFQIARMKNAWGAPVGVEAKNRLALYGERAVPALVAELGDTDPKFVRNVADVLAEIGTETAADALAAAVNRPGALFPEQILAAATDLNKRLTASDEIRRFVLGCLEHEDEEIRWSAADTRWYGEIGFRAALRMLADESARIRAGGASVLRSVGPDEVAPEDRPKLLALLDSEDPLIREMAARIGIAIGNGTADVALRQALVDPDRRVVSVAVQPLGRKTIPWRDELYEPGVRAALTLLKAEEAPDLSFLYLLVERDFPVGYEVFLPIVPAAAARNEPAWLSYLVNSLSLRPDVPAEFVRDGYLSLDSDSDRSIWLDRLSGRLGEEAIPLAREAMDSGNAGLRKWAAKTLLTELPPADWPDLEPLLESKDADTRSNAVAALLRRDGIDSIPRVAEAVKGNPGPAEFAFRTAAKELGKDGYRKLLDAVLDDGPAAERGFHLGWDIVSDEQVLAGLQTGNTWLANQIAPIAGKRRLLEAWPLLLELQSSAAKNALEEIRGYYLGLREYRELRERIDSDAYEKAKRLASSEDATERTAAAMALGALGDRKAIGLLLDLVRDEVPEVRTAAMKALERISAVPAKEE